MVYGSMYAPPRSLSRIGTKKPWFSTTEIESLTARMTRTDAMAWSVAEYGAVTVMVA